MSEAQDAEREVEDLFNEQILGIKEPERDEAPFPAQDAPEPKPVEEITDPDAPPEEETPEESEVSGEETPEEFPPTEEVVPAEPEEEPYLAWAKKQYGDDLDPDKLARAAYEKEQMLGKQAEETRRERKERREAELQSQIAALHTYGVLTDDEEAWVEDRTMQGDLDGAAKACFEANRFDLYAALMDRFVGMGGSAAQQANAHRANLIKSAVSFYQQPEPDSEQAYRQQYQPIFASVGLDLDAHGPIVLGKAQELGGFYFNALENGTEGERRAAVRALYDLATATRTEVAKHRMDDVVQQRVREEELRRGAAGVTSGGNHVEPPKPDPFWDSYNEEVEERGWSGNRPTYGRE